MMDESYLCFNETELDEVVKKLQKEKKIFRVYLNDGNMMFFSDKRVKYIIHVIDFN